MLFFTYQSEAIMLNSTEKKMKIKVNNTFHGTFVNMIIKGDSVRLSQHQAERAERELCYKGCNCGSMWSNHTEIKGYEDCHFEPIVDSSGNPAGAALVQN